MLIRSTGIPYSNFIFRSPDTEGSGGNEGNSEGGNTENLPPAGSEDDSAIKAAIAKAVEEQIAGLKAKNAELIATNKKAKSELEALKSKPTLTEEEYTQFATLKEKIERDEFLRLLTEGKSDEVVERMTKRARLDYESKLAASNEMAAKAEAKAAEIQQKLEATLVNGEITLAAAGSVKPQYVGLIGNMVKDRVKVIDGAVRVVNSEGEIEMSVNGKTPLTVSDLVETLRSDYSDLFVVSTGGGAGGSTKKPQGQSSKLSTEAASKLSMDEFARLRNQGKI